MSDSFSLNELDDLIKIVEDNAWTGDTPLSDCVNEESLKALDELIDNCGKIDMIRCTPDQLDKINKLIINKRFKYSWADKISIPTNFSDVTDD